VRRGLAGLLVFLGVKSADLLDDRRTFDFIMTIADGHLDAVQTTASRFHSGQDPSGE
jgi:hypothetical protein